jgi:surfeit locus 1 family protein
MRIGFRFRTIPFVATVLLVALGVSLGQWQDRRAAQKIAVQTRLAERATAAPYVLTGQPVSADEVEYRPVSVAGEFVREWPLLLDNRPLQGKVGFYLLMPFKIAGSNTHVLVARGWLPRYTGEHNRLRKVMQLGDPAAIAPNAMLQNLEPEQFAAASKLALQPFFIEQNAPVNADDQLQRAWPAPALGVEKHQGYAFQWYALAVMALLFFVITGLRRGTK